jgi:hypothetical protein
MSTSSDIPLIAPKRFVILFTLVHGIASVAAFASSFTLEAQRFDSGASASRGEVLLTTISDILLFPIFTGFLRLPSAQFFCVLGWLPVVANSVLWAFFVWLLFASVQRMRSTAAT